MSDKDSLQGLLKTTSGGDGASYSLAFENGKIKIRRGAKTIVKIEEPKNSVQPRGGALPPWSAAAALTLFVVPLM
jgi:hypothetical protein